MTMTPRDALPGWLQMTLIGVVLVGGTLAFAAAKARVETGFYDGERFHRKLNDWFDPNFPVTHWTTDRVRSAAVGDAIGRAVVPATTAAVVFALGYGLITRLRAPATLLMWHLAVAAFAAVVICVIAGAIYGVVGANDPSWIRRYVGAHLDSPRQPVTFGWLVGTRRGETVGPVLGAFASLLLLWSRVDANPPVGRRGFEVEIARSSDHRG